MALVFVKDGAMINHARRKEPLDFDKVGKRVTGKKACIQK